MSLRAPNPSDISSWGGAELLQLYWLQIVVVRRLLNESTETFLAPKLFYGHDNATKVDDTAHPLCSFRSCCWCWCWRSACSCCFCFRCSPPSAAMTMPQQWMLRPTYCVIVLALVMLLVLRPPQPFLAAHPPPLPALHPKMPGVTIDGTCVKRPVVAKPLLVRIFSCLCFNLLL